MVKVIEDSVSPEGFPRVRWEQEVPTGESVHSAEQSIALKIAAVIMVFVFAAVYAASESFWGAVLAGAIVAGMGLSGDKMFKGGIKVWDVDVPGPPDPSPSAAEREQRARATAILTKQHRGIEVQPDEKQELRVFVWEGEARKRELLAHAPLASIQSLELGTAEEWFMDLAQAQLRRTASAPNSWVIVAPTVGHGVLWIAESAGSKAGIAALHGVLTKRFIVEAPEMQERWRAELEERQRQAGQDGAAA